MGSLLQQRWSLFHSTTATKRRTAKWLVSLMLLSGLHKILVNKITFVDFCGAIAPVTTPRMYLIIFIHIIQCTDWYKTTVDKGHSQALKIGFWIWRLLILRMPPHTKILCKWLILYEWLDQKWLRIYFLFLSKNHKLCFGNSSCKHLLSNNSTNSCWAWRACGLLKFQLWVGCWSNFFWIKFQSTSETVYAAFNFSLKLLSVFSKQLT